MTFVPKDKIIDEEDEESDNSSDIMSILINELYEKPTIDKLLDVNKKCVDLILEEKYKIVLEYFKKLEPFLESVIMDMKMLIPKKFILLFLNNMACCFQKLKDSENCISYLDALIFHFDNSLEKKYKILISEEYFDSLIKSKNYVYDKKNLGDLILELRFCAKFHIQLSISLSQAKRYVDSLNHSKLAALICEDNIIKTNYLYKLIKDEFKNNDNMKENGNNTESNILKEQIMENYKIIMELKQTVLELRNNSSYINNKKNSSKKDILKINKVNSVYHNYLVYTESMINRLSKKFGDYTIKRNNYDSYKDYRKKQIDLYLNDKTIMNDIKNIFETKFTQKDDWIKNLNIDSIIYLSALNYEDLDLVSEPKYELLRDSLLEKVIMLTVSYFCLSENLRYLSKDKNNKNINGEYYLYNALKLSLIFLPASCPIINHYRTTYNKNYKQYLDIIPEGQIMNVQIDLIKKEIYDKNGYSYGNDFIYFIKEQKVDRIIKGETNIKISEIKKDNGGNNINQSSDNKLYKKKDIVIYQNKFFNKKNNKIFKTFNMIDCMIKNKNKKNVIIDISDSNALNNNYDTSSEKITISQPSKNTSIEKDIKNLKLINGSFEIMPNKSYLERAKKSKIKDVKLTKFNFNIINTSNIITEAKTSDNRTYNSIKNDKANFSAKEIARTHLDVKYITKRDCIKNIKLYYSCRNKNKNNNKILNLKTNKDIKEYSNKKDRIKKIIMIRGYKDLSTHSTNKTPKKIGNKNKKLDLSKYFRIKVSNDSYKENLTDRLKYERNIKSQKKKKIW